MVSALAPMGPVRAQPMFGAHGLFMDEVMFALLADGTLWLKGDSLNRDLHVAAGGRPFTYRRGEKEIAMSYYSVPAAILEDRAELVSRAESALLAARRNRVVRRRRMHRPRDP